MERFDHRNAIAKLTEEKAALTGDNACMLISKIIVGLLLLWINVIIMQPYRSTE